jgi:membrane-associated phospholipid phosphatase
LPPDTSPQVQRPESTRLLWIATLTAWALLAIGTGFGRVLVQEHWMSDVMASWALGLALGSGLMLALSQWHPDGEEGPRAPPKEPASSPKAKRK